MTSKLKKPIRFNGHYHEEAPRSFRKLLTQYDTPKHRIGLWNAFVETDLIGINEDDCHILPRVLPGSYLKTIQKTAHDLTLFALRLLSLPEREIRSIFPSGPIRDFLLDELEVIKHRKNRITGSFRFDLAVVGSPTPNNPPRLLEINEIGFDGLARSSLIQNTLFRLIPGLNEKAFALDTAHAEAMNMKRIARTISRFQDDDYNWEEETLIRKAAEAGVQIKMTSPAEFKFKGDPDLPLLKNEKVGVHANRIQIGRSFTPDAIQIGYSLKYKDYLEAAELYRRVVHSKTPMYGPFLSGLVASKMILVLFNDPALRRRFLGSASTLDSVLLPAHSLERFHEHVQKEHDQWVLKQVDGLGGELVFMGAELLRELKSIPLKERNHWVIQKRVKLNTICTHGILSRPREVIADLGVFVQYDWAQGKFLHFEVGGMITRATNRSFKVNVSGGGIQVPVMFSKHG